MKVLNLRGINDLRLEEKDIPKPHKREVLVEVHACGICSSDNARIFKTGTYHFPTVPGHEFCGKVVELGESVNNEYLNRKVSIYPLLPCFECASCKEKQYQLCSNYKYFGSRNDGGFSEYIAVPVWNLVLLDDSVDYSVGALMEPAAVAMHALDIGTVKENDNVLVVGTGTIGALIGLFAQKKGAKVWIAGRTQKALEVFADLSLNTIDIDKPIEDIIQKTDGQLIDVVFEAVGSNDSLKQCILSAKTNGTVVVAGNPCDNMELEKDVYWKILRKQLVVKGTWNSEYNDINNNWKEVSELMSKKEIPFEKLITREFDIDHYKDAFEMLLNKSIRNLKIMITMNNDKV